MADDAAEQAYAAAVEEIARVKEVGETSISFGDERFRALTVIPPELAGLATLKYLNLKNTQVSDLAPLARLTNLETLGLENTHVNDFTPLVNLINLETLDLDDTQVSDLAPLAGLKNLQALWLINTQVSDLALLASLRNLRWLYLQNTKVSDLTPLAGLTNLNFLDLDDTKAIDLRPLTKIVQLGQRSAFQADAFQANAFQLGRSRLHFRNTPATARDGRLAELAEIKNDEERTRKTLEYLRSLPPWPEPYTPAYTPDGSPPQPIGGEAEAEAGEVLVPAPVRAPLEVEVVDGRLRPARPGDGLGEETHERARQAWQALRDFLADLADIRPRIVNQMPQLERALTRLEDALGADYEAANPIAMGINGNRVIAQAGAAGETLEETDAAELREFAAALSLFLERFPAWLAYRDEGTSARSETPQIDESLPEIEAITEELREHDAIDPAIPESLEKQAGDVRSNPEDALATRGLKDSLNNVLGRLGEIVAIGKRWVAREIKDVAGKTWTGIKLGIAARGTKWAFDNIDQLVAAARDFFAARAGELRALAEAHPTEFGWLVKLLHLLGL